MGGRTAENPWNRITIKLLEELKDKFHVEAVILYGSWARGGGGDWSDIDLLVITDSVKNMSILDRFTLTTEFRKYKADVLFYTYNEVDSMITKGNPIALSALIDGIPITISPRVEKLIAKAKATYAKKGRTWITRDNNVSR